MDKRDQDALLAEALKRGTDGAATQKSRVWRTVSGRISRLEAQRKEKEMKRRRNGWIAAGMTAVTATALFVFFSMTPEGTALADRIVKFFSPDKRIDTRIEGETETQNASLNTNTSDEIGYVIYIDTERYAKETVDGMDVYKALNAPEGLPPVRMEITQDTGTPAEQAYEQALADAKKRFGTAEGQGRVEEPVKGWALFAYGEGGGVAPYEDVYIVDNTKGGSFTIRCRMFREAAEGHGARFHAMLKTFEVVRSSQLQTGAPEQSPAPTLDRETIAELQRKPLSWDDLALFGVKLDTPGAEAVQGLTQALGKAESDESAEDAGGTTRTLTWPGGTAAVIRNGKLYSLETQDKAAVLPNGLRAGLKLADFETVLGEPREAVGALAWGVGSNDNLFAFVQDGTVVKVKVSLVE